MFPSYVEYGLNTILAILPNIIIKQYYEKQIILRGSHIQEEDKRRKLRR
jgi:hypothetical protein